MYNYANGQYWGTPCQSFDPDQSIAEWIVERVTISCGPTWLAGTTAVNWHSAFADSIYAGGNMDHNIGYYSNNQITMQDQGTLETASNLGTGTDGGSTFTSTYVNQGPYCG